MNYTLMDGDKIIEVVSGRYNKGTAVSEILGDKASDFILCFGDDITDEFMFNDLPSHAVNVKVGKKIPRPIIVLTSPMMLYRF